jgi:DNA-binding transcriptional LysR family regulator
VQEDLKANVLAAVPLADVQIRRDLALVFRKDKALSRAALAFIDIAVKIKTADTAAGAK